jgi:hypothetical protein
VTLECRHQQAWVFAAKVTNKFILGLHVLSAEDASVDLERHVL